MSPQPDDERITDWFGRCGDGPLAGLVVADFSRVLAGPYCTMLLADMGATVIKIESPLGDDTRAWRPPVYDEESTYYLSINRNKRSIILDFNDQEDLRVARDIAARADVLVENFKPGGLLRFGLDYDAISADNPSLVYASISGFGTAQGSHLPGYDLLVQAISGMMSMTGSPQSDPTRTGVALFDVMTGLHATIGVLAAVRHRERTGEGQHVELNLLSSALSGLVNQSASYAIGGTVPTRLGNAHPSVYPYEPMETADGHIVIAVGNDRQFARLCTALGSPELADNVRYSTSAQRNLNRAELHPLLIDGLSLRTAAEWFDHLSAAGIPCAPILDVQEGFEMAERLGLGPIVHTGEGSSTQPTVRNPIDFSLTPVTYDLAPPRLGADSSLIRGWLAMNAAEANPASTSVR